MDSKINESQIYTASNFLQEPSIYNSPATLKKILDGNGLSMQKKFGQNFLIDEGIRKKLVALLELRKGKTVWEIGPGLGSMTSLLVKTGAEITAFEIDKGFIKLLHVIFDDAENFHLIEGDVLKNWFKESQKQRPDVFFGNLPYNIAATLILSTIEKEVFFDKMLVTVQKEVAERFYAIPGPDYSATSVLVQAFYDVRNVMTIGSSSFWPAPKVVSKAILLVPTDKYKKQITGCEKLFFNIVKALFAARRKNLRNNFQNYLKSKMLDGELLDLLPEEWKSRRAETLTVQDFVDLTVRLEGAVGTR